MAMAEQIRKALIIRKTPLKELAAKLGCSSQNLSGKLKRDNFSENELLKIAEALNLEYQCGFVVPETGKSV